MHKAAWLRALPWAVVALSERDWRFVLVLWAPWRATAPPRVTRTTITLGRGRADANGTTATSPSHPTGRASSMSATTARNCLFVRSMRSNRSRSRAELGAQAAIRLTGWPMGRLRRPLRIQKVAITGGPRDDDRPGRRHSSAARRGRQTTRSSSRQPDTGLQRVSAAGAIPEVLTRPDREHGEADHLWPEFCPAAAPSSLRLRRKRADSIQPRWLCVTCAQGRRKCWCTVAATHTTSPAGTWSTSRRARCERLPSISIGSRPTVRRSRCLPRLAHGGGAGDFAVANDGTLVYVELREVSRRTHARWCGSTARARRRPSTRRRAPTTSRASRPTERASPSGATIRTNDIWIWDLERKTLTPLTLDPGEDQHPLWTRDGQRIIFSLEPRRRRFNLWWQAADGTGEAERLTKSSKTSLPAGSRRTEPPSCSSKTTVDDGRDELAAARSRRDATA